VIKKTCCEAAGENALEAYILRYVEESFEPRTKLKEFSSALLCH
jgi:hypothetical protein